CQYTRQKPQPSILEASSRSRGTPLRNWRSKKTLKAPAKKLVTHNGYSVLYQPSARMMRNNGIIVTCPGTIIVPSISAKQKLRPGHCSRAKLYATSDELSSVPTMFRITMKRLVAM